MTPLVMVHGFMAEAGNGLIKRADFGARYQLITIDLPGFGANAQMPALNSIGAMADWVLAHVSGLGIDRFHLLGHSMGGMIVQEMIARAPHRVDKLILYATGAQGALPGRFEPIETSKARAIEDGAPATARRISATWFLQKEAAPGYPSCAQIAECSSPQRFLRGSMPWPHGTAAKTWARLHLRR